MMKKILFILLMVVALPLSIFVSCTVNSDTSNVNPSNGLTLFEVENQINKTITVNGVYVSRTDTQTSKADGVNIHLWFKMKPEPEELAAAIDQSLYTTWVYMPYYPHAGVNVWVSVGNKPKYPADVNIGDLAWGAPVNLEQAVEDMQWGPEEKPQEINKDYFRVGPNAMSERYGKYTSVNVNANL